MNIFEVFPALRNTHTHVSVNDWRGHNRTKPDLLVLACCTFPCASANVISDIRAKMYSKYHAAATNKRYMIRFWNIIPSANSKLWFTEWIVRYPISLEWKIRSFYRFFFSPSSLFVVARNLFQKLEIVRGNHVVCAAFFFFFSWFRAFYDKGIILLIGKKSLGMIIIGLCDNVMLLFMNYEVFEKQILLLVKHS